MNKKAFTMIEVLAVIVILGILSMIGIYAISSNIENSRKSGFVDNAIVYCDKMIDMRGADQFPIDISDYRGILIPVNKLKGNDHSEDISTPYGDLDINSSYVVAVKQDRQIKNYITMIASDGSALINEDCNNLRNEWILNIHTKYTEENFENKSVEDLKQIAKEKGIKVNDEMTKEALIKAIKETPEEREKEKFKNKLREIISIKDSSSGTKVMAGTDEYKINKKTDNYIILEKING